LDYYSIFVNTGDFMHRCGAIATTIVTKSHEMGNYRYIDKIGKDSREANPMKLKRQSLAYR